MGRPPLSIDVTPKDQKELARLLSGGVQQVQVVLRALVLLQLAKGASAPRISQVVPLTPQPSVRLRVVTSVAGWNLHCSRSSAPAQPRCSTMLRNNGSSPWCAAILPRAAPAGPCDWWRRKLSNAGWSPGWEGKRFGFCSSTTTSSRGGKTMWCVAELDEEYISKMEDVLETYEKPHDPGEPVVCLDEKPVTLHADVRPTSPAKPGREARRDNEYERRGTANVFCAVEPKAGRHFTFATPDRSAFEFAHVVFELAMQYQQADTIHLVLDNLNIHCLKSLTDAFGMEMGCEVWDRFTIHFTPKHGSWLNQAEIEIGLFSRQCLGKRRIPTLISLRRESRAWNRRMNHDKIKINWKFDRRTARRKFGYKRRSSSGH
uniref:Tc1-like transposase DDE domain-containing protein n=1 Tax=Solibacter usitatus (strain Ellin6076) TaxID=234267 RepID=Q01P88_SOLUE